MMTYDMAETLFGRHSSTVLREQVRETVGKAGGRTIKFELFNNKEKGVVEDELRRLGFAGNHFFSLLFEGPPWDGAEYGRLSPQDPNEWPQE